MSKLTLTSEWTCVMVELSFSIFCCSPGTIPDCCVCRDASDNGHGIRLYTHAPIPVLCKLEKNIRRKKGLNAVLFVLFLKIVPPLLSMPMFPGVKLSACWGEFLTRTRTY